MVRIRRVGRFVVFIQKEKSNHCMKDIVPRVSWDEWCMGRKRSCFHRTSMLGEMIIKCMKEIVTVWRVL